MDRHKVNVALGQIAKSIEDIEPYLDETEFAEYCNNAYALMAQWRILTKNMQ